jgi:hypothetical protein
MANGSSRGLNYLIAPSGPPTILNRLRETRRIQWRQALAKQGSEDPMHQPPRTTVDQRQSGRDQGVVGSAKPNLLSERQPEHGPRLGIVRQALPSRSIDQRIEIGQAAQRFPGDGGGQGGVGRWEPAPRLCRIFHRLAAPKHRIEDSESRLARWQTFKGWHDAT